MQCEKIKEKWTVPKMDFNCVMITNLHCKLLTYWYIPHIEEVGFSVNTGKSDVTDECTSFLCTSVPNNTYITSCTPFWVSVHTTPHTHINKSQHFGLAKWPGWHKFITTNYHVYKAKLYTCITASKLYWFDCVMYINTTYSIIILYDRYICIGRGW